MVLKWVEVLHGRCQGSKYERSRRMPVFEEMNEMTENSFIDSGSDGNEIRYGIRSGLISSGVFNESGMAIGNVRMACETVESKF